MYNNTLEEYKKAIKAKYEIEKEGQYFDYLNCPSRGKLRDLCWTIFENNAAQEDLNVFKNLLCLDFDHTKKNKFKEQKDKFRPIETFFKGETDPSNIDAINLAAIMVDFQPRPFKKFNEKCRIAEQKQTEGFNKIKPFVEVEKEVIDVENLVESENEETKEIPKKGNLFLDFKDMITKKMYPTKIIAITVGTVALVSSACLYFVQKKE
ncbi:hypothetical protein GKZ90_0017060 [Flavobacterium sp. MC2016-06]|uniref:hypothetical protein n=1 Tax=Flavobacterium sp. MC2016-06 TaxID=2676308 RepID=UPI0012BAE35E|nr:hypothetical protein [Flavobacterium sp. MC2016-06]MBU3861671.1 hypothetical protein [Flavobacterium sp. MC2016-06]